MDTIPQVAAAMQHVLTATATSLARSTGFVQRRSKLDGAAFTQAWVFACLANPCPTWEDLSQSAATLITGPASFNQASGARWMIRNELCVWAFALRKP